MAFDFGCAASVRDGDGVAAECMPLALAYCDAGGGVDERYFGFRAFCTDRIDRLTCCEVCDCVPGDEHWWWRRYLRWMRDWEIRS